MQTGELGEICKLGNDVALHTSAEETHHVDAANVSPQQQQQGGQRVPVTRD